MLTILTSSIWLLVAQPFAAQPDSLTPLRQVELSGQAGFVIPHSPDLVPISGNTPVGITLSYGQTNRTRRAYESCNCFAQTGFYLNYMTFNSPGVLGRTVGAGGFFEPRLSASSRRAYLSIRITAGLTYLTRPFDAVSNPTNTFFSAPVSGLLALSLQAHQRLSSQWELVAAANYNHISNGGIRQPNRGMNFPTASVGLRYQLQTVSLPNPQRWRINAPNTRSFGRAVLAGSVRVLPQADPLPEQTRPIWSVIGLAGYRLSRFNALSAGLEYLDDGFIEGQIQRDGLSQNYRQLALLAGYERWQGRYRFAVHQGMNLLLPGVPYTSRFFQRYQLLYVWPGGLVAGIGLKANLNVAEGFDARMGWTF